MSARKFAVKWIVTAVALAVATKLVSGIHVDGGWVQYLWVSLVFGFINTTLGTAAKLFTFPLVILTLGLFLLVVNALMLELTASLINSFSIDSFGSALGAALIVAIVAALLNVTVGRRLTHAK